LHHAVVAPSDATGGDGRIAGFRGLRAALRMLEGSCYVISTALRRVIGVLVLVFASGLAHAAPPPKLPNGVQFVRTVEGIDEYRLANGLQVLLYPDSAKPTVTVNVTYKVGSRQENYGETGMAHLLEHLIFKGSKNYPSPDKEFSRRGFRNNGSTWFDRTNYFSTFQASDDNLRWALGWSADAMVNSFIARKALDSEMTVVRNELEMRENQPGLVMFRRSLALSFDWHNYGNDPVGARADIEKVRIENLQAFYRTYYQPDNATLIVAGKFDEAKTLGWIAQDFGRIPKPKRTLPPIWTVEPTQDGERSFVVRRKGDVQLVQLSYRVPSALHPDTEPLGVAAEVLSDTPNGRLHRELVEKGLAAQVFSFAPNTHDGGLVIFGAVVKQGDSVERARDKLIEIVETSLAGQPATTDEIERVRKDTETSAERTLASPEDFGVALSEYVALGDWRLFFASRDATLRTESPAVTAAATKYFRRDNRVVGLFLPEDNPLRAEIPEPPTAATRLADFKPRATVAAGEAFDPSQDNIDKRTRRAAAGDLKLALLPKKTRGETVNAVLNFRWGDEKSLAGQGIAAMLADAMVPRGTAKLTRQQIADEMTRLKMTGSLRSFQTTRENLPAALRLSAHVLREASFPPAEFELLKRELLTSLQAQLNDPAERSRDALRKHFNIYPPGDPRYYLSLDERIDAVGKATVDDAQRFHQAFWGTSRGEIAMVGDFDDKAIEPLLRELFVGWQSKAPYAPVLNDYRDVKPARLVVDTPDKENAFYRARMNLELRDDDPDYVALLLADYAFGGGSGLANRLIDRLRQKDGLSYGAGSTLLVGSRDRAAAYQLGAIVAPQNVQRVEQAAREEIERLVKDGLTAKEVDDARNGLLQERLLNRTRDGTLAAAWTNNLDLGRSFAFSKAVEERLRALSVADVNAAVRRRLDPARFTVVIAGDAKKGVK
jgi:zinc protease